MSLKRTPLARKTPLARGEATLARTTPLAPGKRKQRKKRPPHVRDEARKRSHGRCVVCIHDAGGDWRSVGREGRIAHLHHVLDVQVFPALELHPDNHIGLCVRHHEQHTNAFRRVPWAALPDCAITLAYSTSGTAAMFIERRHPR